MLTLWCVSVSIGSLWFVGLPIARLFFRAEEDKEKIWVSAPFIDLAAIILVLQNLVYLDIPIRYSTPWLWVLTVGLVQPLFKEYYDHIFASMHHQFLNRQGYFAFDEREN